MAELHYKQLLKQDIKGKNYVEIAFGKQRKKKFRKTSIFYEPEVFGLFEAVIWDHYREYNRKGLYKAARHYLEIH